MMSAPLVAAQPRVTGLRVAALVATETVSGPGRQLAALARELSEVGIEFLVVLLHRRGRPTSDFARYLADHGVAHRVVDDRAPFDWRLIKQVRLLLDDWQPAVVQTHMYKASAVAYVLRRMGAPWKWVGCFHGLTREDRKARFYHWLDRLLLRGADRIVVVAREQVKLFPRGMPKVRVIHNATLRLARQDDQAEQVRLDTVFAQLGHPRIGVVGRLSPEKGVDVFLEACGLLAARGKTFAALVAGDGPERDRLQTLSRRLQLEPHVHFLSHVRDIASIYGQLDLLVLPSRSEGLPNALLEALQADLPIVATRVGGVPEVIGSSTAAVLVPPESADALAGGIERALAAGRTPETSAARARLARQFSLSRRVADHLALYGDVLYGPSISERSLYAL